MSYNQGLNQSSRYKGGTPATNSFSEGKAFSSVYTYGVYVNTHWGDIAQENVHGMSSSIKGGYLRRLTPDNHGQSNESVAYTQSTVALRDEQTLSQSVEWPVRHSGFANIRPQPGVANGTPKRSCRPTVSAQNKVRTRDLYPSLKNKHEVLPSISLYSRNEQRHCQYDVLSGVGRSTALQPGLKVNIQNQSITRGQYPSLGYEEELPPLISLYGRRVNEHSLQAPCTCKECRPKFSPSHNTYTRIRAQHMPTQKENPSLDSESKRKQVAGGYEKQSLAQPQPVKEGGEISETNRLNDSGPSSGWMAATENSGKHSQESSVKAGLNAINRPRFPNDQGTRWKMR